jgi:hypothetical protein
MSKFREIMPHLEQLRSKYRFDTERRHSLTFPCALKGARGFARRAKPTFPSIYNRTTNPVLPVCEPQATSMEVVCRYRIVRISNN